MTATEILDEIFTEMRTDFASITGGKYGTLRASFGYDAEISAEIAKLATLKTTNTTIYPLIAACLPEYVINYPNKNECIVNIKKIVICTHSDANLNYQQRKEINFTPILIPLYELFVRHFNKNKHVRYEYNRMIKAEFIPFYSDGSKHQFSDMIDGIVIRDLTFKTKTICQEVEKRGL